MSIRYTKSFKIQAVEKALQRPNDVSQNDIAQSLGVGKATLSHWIIQSRNNEIEPNEASKRLSSSKEKRPQDWNSEERFNLIMACHSLDEKSLNEHCRAQGVYPHHISQWKQEFMSGTQETKETPRHSDIKGLKAENKALKKELHRKEKALAETAALLVLKKKVHEIWGTDEGNSP